MKKILIITLFCLVLLSGCKKEEAKPNETTEPVKKYLTKMEMNIKLTEYEKEKVKKFKESMNQIIYDIYESDEDLGEGVFDIFGLFTELLKLGVIS